MLRVSNILVPVDFSTGFEGVHRVCDGDGRDASLERHALPRVREGRPHGHHRPWGGQRRG